MSTKPIYITVYELIACLFFRLPLSIINREDPYRWIYKHRIYCSLNYYYSEIAINLDQYRVDVWQVMPQHCCGPPSWYIVVINECVATLRQLKRNNNNILNGGIQDKDNGPLVSTLCGISIVYHRKVWNAGIVNPFNWCFMDTYPQRKFKANVI